MSAEPMSRGKVLGCALGALMFLGGVVIWGQALGYAGDGPFTDSVAWTYLGALLAGLGIALVLAIVQGRNRDK